MASVIALALEKNKDNYKDFEVGWLITSNVLQEENAKLKLASILKAHYKR